MLLYKRLQLPHFMSLPLHYSVTSHFTSLPLHYSQSPPILCLCHFSILSHLPFYVFATSLFAVTSRFVLATSLFSDLPFYALLLRQLRRCMKELEVKTSLCFLQFMSWTIQILIGGKVVTTEGKAFSQQILLQQTCRLNLNTSVSLLIFVVLSLSHCFI